MPPSKRPVPPPDYTEGMPPGFAGSFLLFLGAAALKFGSFMLFYAIFSKTLGLMPGMFLCDLPGPGAVFCELAPDMALGDLLAMMVALFSTLTPIVIWNAAIEHDALRDPGAWLADPANKVWAIICGSIYALILLLETVNLFTLIASELAPGPFEIPGQNSPLMNLLAENMILAVFVALMISVINAALAFIAVKSAHTLKRAVRS